MVQSGESGGVLTTAKEPRILLMYSPLQFARQDTVKPDGSLSLPYVAGALREAGFDVSLLDACVGTEKDSLADTFYQSTELPSGFLRVGLSRERIAQEIANYDVIGISSIFTVQTTMVLDLIRLVKEVDPEKLVIAGGVNARCLADRFFAAGADVICLSESERTIVQIGNMLRRGSRDFRDVPGIAFKQNGKIAYNAVGDVVSNLDELPMPAWDMLPLERYWEISRPHGGDFPPGTRLQYASLMTSRGCPFSCAYCHISKETKGSLAGNISRLRLKSIDRVMEEIDTLKALGAEYVFFEDDTLLAKKKRIIEIFRGLRAKGLKLIDVNGVNLCHLLRNAGGGKLVVDRDLLAAMAECGFEMLSLPFESGSQRIIDKYASSKWQLDRTDTIDLIHATKELGIKALGNYTIGYPDETFEELSKTIMLARHHMSEGLDVASFFIIVPFPGTTLFDMVLREGYLPPDWEPDAMKWTSTILINTLVSSETLDAVREIAWKLINRQEFVKQKEDFGVATLEQSAVLV